MGSKIEQNCILGENFYLQPSNNLKEISFITQTITKFESKLVKVI